MPSGDPVRLAVAVLTVPPCSQAEASEMEHLRNELQIQETEERILQKEKEKMERAIQQRLDIQLANQLSLIHI